MTATTKKQFTALGLFILSIYLGFCSLTYTNAVGMNGGQRGIMGNLMLDSNQARMTGLQAQTLDQNKALEFMVWPDERRKVLQQSIQSTQQLINIRPTQILLWQQLLDLQYEFSPNPTELTWILDKLYVMTQWNDNSMVALARYCVPSVFSPTLESPSACNNIVTNLPDKNDANQLSRKIGISRDDLAVVIQHYQE